VAKLRDYQRETIDDFECVVAAGARSVLVTAPTGSGKTVIVSATVARTVAAGQLGLVLGNRRQILEHVTSAPPATPIADMVEASRFPGSGHDVDIDAFDTGEGPLVAEVKSRRSGAGFVTLEKWLGEYDCLFLRRNCAEPMVLLRWRVWAALLARVRR
jgi:hypothetical protein